MDFYSIVKFLHVLAATAWVGGGFIFLIASEIAQRAPGPVYGGFSAVAARLGNLVFVPASLLTLALGIALTLMSWSFADLWIILALIGIAVSLGIGITQIKPASDKFAELIPLEGPDSARVRALSGGVLRVGRFDLVLMGVIIADMVFKPGYGDVTTLSVMGVVLLAAAFAFLVRPRGAPVTA